MPAPTPASAAAIWCRTGRRQRAAGVAERHQVLAGAMHHLQDYRIGQQRHQGIGHAGHEGIDQQDVAASHVALVAQGNLDQRQLRPVGALADEFGVQPDHGWGIGEARAQRVGGVDPFGHAAIMQLPGWVTWPKFGHRSTMESPCASAGPFLSWRASCSRPASRGSRAGRRRGPVASVREGSSASAG